MIERIKRKDKNGYEYWSVPFPTLRKEIPENMTSEMWQVYKFIEAKTLKGLTTTVGEICREIPYYQRRHVTEGNYSNCPELYEDIFLINTLYRGQHDKFILTNSNKIKLATKEEALKKQQTIATRYFRLNWELESLTELAENDGQMKILSNQGKPIYEFDDEGNIKINKKAKEYKDSYVEKKLEDMSFEELRTIYRELCEQKNLAPINLTKDLYIKEIKSLRNEIK